MGCDIHMIAETKSKYTDSDTWEPLLDSIFKNDDYDSSRSLSRYNAPYMFQPYDDRNYEVFSVLANVRNSHDVKPISEPRGYPSDIHKVSEWLLDGYDFVDHSETWLSLEEVFAYDWETNLSPIYHPGKPMAVSAARFLEKMRVLEDYGKTENCDVRLIFGFDS